MDTLRSTAHLQKELGNDLFNVLISSDNTAAVREFAAKLAGILPTTVTIVGRTYDILGLLREGEDYVKGDTMVTRAKEMTADLGQDEGEYLLAHQDEIPAALRGKAAFVFTAWRHPDDSGSVAYVCWSGDRWVQGWGWLSSDFSGGCRVLRRK